MGGVLCEPNVVSTHSQLSRPIMSGHYTFVESGRPGLLPQRGQDDGTSNNNNTGESSNSSSTTGGSSNAQIMLQDTMPQLSAYRCGCMSLL